MLFTKKYKKQLADAQKEIKELRELITKGFAEIQEEVSKKYIHEKKTQDDYNIEKIVDEWLNGEQKEGED